MERKKKFFDCECGTEGFNWELDIDYFEKHYHAQIYMSLWHLGTVNNKPSLWEKLRHCWQILKTGKNFPDSLVLHIDTAKEAGEELLRLVNSIEDEVKKHG